MASRKVFSINLIQLFSLENPQSKVEEETLVFP